MKIGIFFQLYTNLASHNVQFALTSNFLHDFQFQCAWFKFVYVMCA